MSLLTDKIDKRIIRKHQRTDRYAIDLKLSTNDMLELLKEIVSCETVRLNYASPIGPNHVHTRYSPKIKMLVAYIDYVKEYK